MCDEGLNIKKELNDNHAYANNFKVLFNERKVPMGSTLMHAMTMFWLQESKSCMVLCI